MAIGIRAGPGDTVTDDLEFDQFMRRTMPAVLRRAITYCGHRQTAEDAVQEAYVELHEHWSTVTAPLAWLETTVRRRTMREAGRWRARWRTADLELAMPTAATAEEEAEARAVLRAVRRLPARQRQVLVALRLEGRTYDDLASELAISKGAVGANLHRARAKLAELLALPPVAEPGDQFQVDRAQLDPLVRPLRAADDWLAGAIEADEGRLAALRAAIWRAIGQ
jgi:RNA polymerase sigma-70 factor (ECF subfamily)